MKDFVEILFALPVMMIAYQIYSFSVSRSGLEKQERCRTLGIAYMSLGIVSLAFHSIAFVLAGLILIMFGFRLMASGLDRLDKKVFIDRYDDGK